MSIWQQEPTDALATRDSDYAAAYRTRDGAQQAQATMARQAADDAEARANEIADHAAQAQIAAQQQQAQEEARRAAEIASHAAEAQAHLTTPPATLGALTSEYEARGEQAPGTAGQMRDVAQGFPLGAGAQTSALAPQPPPGGPQRPVGAQGEAIAQVDQVGAAAQDGYGQQHDSQAGQPQPQQFQSGSSLPPLPVNRTGELGIGDTTDSGAAGVQAGLADIGRGAQRSVQDVGQGASRLGTNTRALGAAIGSGDVAGGAGSLAQMAIGAGEAAMGPLNLPGHIVGEGVRGLGGPEPLAQAADFATNFVAQGGPKGAVALAKGVRNLPATARALSVSDLGQAFLAQGAPGAAAQIASEGLGALKAIPGAAQALAQAAPAIGRTLWDAVVTPDVKLGIATGAHYDGDPDVLASAVHQWVMERRDFYDVTSSTGVEPRALVQGASELMPTLRRNMATAWSKVPAGWENITPDSALEDITPLASGKQVPFVRANGQTVLFDSAYEAMLGHLLDSNPDVAVWTNDTTPADWVFYTKANGKPGIYMPDFKVVDTAGNVEYIEIKASKMIGASGTANTAGGANLNVMSKAQAARDYFAQRGAGYRLFTEDQIGRDALRGADPATMPGLADLAPADLANVRSRMRSAASQHNAAAEQAVAAFNGQTPQARIVPAARFGIVQGGAGAGGAAGASPPPGIATDVWQTQVAALDAALAKARSSYEAGGRPAAPQAVAESEQAYRAAVDAQLRASGRENLIGRPETYGNGLTSAASGTGPDTSFGALLRAAAGNPTLRGSDLLAGRAGAVAGGVAGATSGPSDQSPGDRIGRTAEGALFGGLTGIAGAQAVRGVRAVAPILAQLDRLGVLPAAEEEASRLRASIEQRAAAWDQAQQRLGQLQSEIALRGGAGTDVGAIERPAWAAASGGRRAMTDAELADLAQRSGVNPYEPQWYQRLDPATIRQYQQEVVSSKTGTTQVGQTPGQARAYLAELRRQSTALQGQLRTFEREMNQDLTRVSVLEQRAGREPFPFESTEPGAAAPVAAPDVAPATAPAAMAGTTPARLVRSRGQALPSEPPLATGATRAPDAGPPIRAGTRGLQADLLPQNAGLPPSTPALGSGQTYADALVRHATRTATNAGSVMGIRPPYAEHDLAALEQQAAWALAQGKITRQEARGVWEAINARRAQFGLSPTSGPPPPDVGPPLTGGTQPRLLGPDGRPLTLPPDMAQPTGATRAPDTGGPIAAGTRGLQPNLLAPTETVPPPSGATRTPATGPAIQGATGTTAAGGDVQRVLMALVGKDGKPIPGLSQPHAVEALAAAAKDASLPPGTLESIAKRPGGLDRLTTLYRAALLSNPATNLRILLQTAGTHALVPVERLAASVLEPAVAALDWTVGGRLAAAGREVRPLTDLNAQLEGWAGGFNLALRKAGEVLKTGVDSDVGAQAAQLQPAGGGTLPERAADLVLRTHGANFAFWRALDEAAETRVLANRQALKEVAAGTLPQAQARQRALELVAHPTAAMLDAAQQAGQYRSLTDSAGRTRSAIVQLLNSNPALRLLVPFARVPLNAAVYALERSPVGALPLARAIARGATTGELADRAARTMLGTGVAISLYGYARAGNVTGNLPADPAARAAWAQEGKIAHAIRIGTSWYSYERAPLGVGASLALLAQVAAPGATGKPDPSLVQRLFDGTVAAAQDTRALDGFTSLLDAIQAPGTAGDKAVQFLQSEAKGALVPAGVQALARATDRVQRAPQGFGQQLQSAVPGLRQAVPAKLDALGRPVPATNTGLEALSPITRSPVRGESGGESGSPLLTRYLGSAGPEQDVQIERAVTAVRDWRAHPTEYPRPTAQQMDLFTRYGGRENPQYRRQQSLAQAQQRREKVAAASQPSGGGGPLHGIVSLFGR